MLLLNAGFSVCTSYFGTGIPFASATPVLELQAMQPWMSSRKKIWKKQNAIEQGEDQYDLNSYSHDIFIGVND